MRWAVIRPEYNSKGKSDVTSVFEPEADGFMQYWPGSTLIVVNNRLPAPKRREQTRAGLEAITHPFAGVCYFGHGLKVALPSIGETTSTIGGLMETAVTVSRRNGPNGVGDDAFACIYNACTTGAGVGADGGMCDVTRDALCKLSMEFARCFGHLNAGHADENPNGVFVDGEGSPVGCGGGRYVIQPRAKPLWGEHVWMLDHVPAYRYWMPVQSVQRILWLLNMPREQRTAVITEQRGTLAAYSWV